MFVYNGAVVSIRRQRDSIEHIANIIQTPQTISRVYSVPSGPAFNIADFVSWLYWERMIFGSFAGQNQANQRDW